MNSTYPSNQVILLTVDVEDWFQVENLRPSCPVSSWSSYELRVEKNTHRLLDLFDEIKVKNKVDRRQDTVGQVKETGDPSTSLRAGSRQETEGRWQNTEDRRQYTVCNRETATMEGNEHLTTDNGEQRKLHATFFVLGWLGERLPNLVREIHARGHELASHGYGHEICFQCSTDGLREDLEKSKKLLEDIIGARVYGYRAPSFSINNDILKMIEDAGYVYDSSYNSFGMHGRYGKISLNGNGRSGIAYKMSDVFYELPISNLKVFPSATLGTLGILAHFRHFLLPWGGGAYFRLIPSWLFIKGVREILRQQQAYLFYMHPWEVDPEQPRPQGASAFSRFKHYTNLSRTEGKLSSFLQEFHDCHFVSCHEHLQTKGTECHASY